MNTDFLNSNEFIFILVSKISAIIFLKMFQIISQKGRKKLPHFMFLYPLTPPSSHYKE